MSDRALRNSSCLLVMISPEANRSQYVQHEIDFARASNVRIIPVRMIPSEVHPSLGTIQHFDLESFENYDQGIRALAERLFEVVNKNVQGGIGSAHRVPDLPPNYVLTSQFDNLKSILISNPQKQTVLVIGEAGSGKTVLALALCHDLEIQRRFRDGIFWLGAHEISPSADFFEQLAYRTTTSDIADRTKLMQLVQHGTCLIVLDGLDEVNPQDMQQLFYSIRDLQRQLGTTSRLLCTSRNIDSINQIEAAHFSLKDLTEEEAFEFLEALVGKIPEEFTVRIRQFLASTGYSPLLIRLLADQINDGSAGDMLERILNTSLEGTLNAIIAKLSDSEKRRLIELASLDEISIEFDQVAQLWRLRAGLSSADTTELLERFSNLGLVVQSGSQVSMRHASIREYLRNTLIEQNNTSHDSSPRYDVLLGYTGEDRAFKERIANDLRSVGLKVWDDRNIQIGMDFRAETRKAISQSACVVVLISSSDRITDLDDTDPTVPIIPVLIEGNDLPTNLQRLQFLDLRHPANYDSQISLLIQRIREYSSHVPDTVPPTQIFLNYSHIDRDFARRLNESLRNAGYSTWIDSSGLSIGMDWQVQLEKALDATATMVIVVSPEAMQSQYVRWELDYFIRQQKRIVPIILRQTPPDIMPIELAQIRWFDFSTLDYETAFTQLQSSGVFFDSISNLTSLNEAETNEQLIRPRLVEAGWNTLPFSLQPDVRLDTEGRQKRADYVLRYNNALALAVVECKRYAVAASDGVMQAKQNAEALDTKFAYATNGQEIIEFNVITGTERQIDSFPTAHQLLQQTISSSANTFESLLRTAVQLVSSVETRSSLWLVDRRSEELYLYASYGSYTNDETRLRFKRGVGIIGEVWERHQPLLVDLSSLQPNELRNRWRLSEQQINATRQLGSIIAVPISNSNSSEILGILVMDSRKSPSESGFSGQTIISQLLEFAQLFRQLIDTLPDKKEQAEIDYPDSQTTEGTIIQSVIGLFGPVASGKTALFQAFVGSINADINSLISRHPMEIFFRSSESLTLGAGEFPPATQMRPTSTRIQFGRRPKNPRDNRQRESSFIHDVTIVDNAGEAYTYGIDGSVSSLDQMKNSKEEFSWWQSLGGCHSIIAILDPTLLDNRLSKEEYARLISRLGWFSANTEDNLKRRIALCITKVDLLGRSSISQHTDEVVETFFGSNMMQAIRMLKSKFGENQVRTFTVSAVGFDASGQTNLEKTTNQLRDISHWQPYKIYDPFFWLFQQMEVEHLERKQPSLMSRIFRNDPLQNYIPYTIDVK